MQIKTERLLITTFTPDMAQSVHENSLDEDNRRFVPDEVFETVEEARETIEFLMGCYESGEGPLVYPVLRHSGEVVGYVQAAIDLPVSMDHAVTQYSHHETKNCRTWKEIPPVFRLICKDGAGGFLHEAGNDGSACGDHEHAAVQRAGG